jgi:hypothetical protein
MNGLRETLRNVEIPDATIWVPSQDEKQFVSKVLAKAQMELSREGAPVLRRVQFIQGFDCLEKLSSEGATLFYLPKGGIGRDVQRAASRCSLPFFFRLLSEEQLSDGEVHSISEVWSQVVQEFRPNEQTGGRIFLGWAGDPASETALLKWMRTIFDLVAARRTHEAAQLESQHLDALAERIAGCLTLHSFGRSNCGGIFAIANLRRAWAHRSASSLKVMDTVISRYGELSQERSAGAWEEYQRNILRKNPNARVARWPLAQHYEGLLTRLDGLANNILDSQSPALRGLGVRLESLLDSKPPTLSVVGAFSSGKTTLINNVLLGERPGCAFRTRHTANTAIVYEIISCGSSEVESVEFSLCKKVEHPLFDADGEGDTWSKYRKMLLELLNADILLKPVIHFETGVDVFSFKERCAQEFLKSPDPEAARRSVELERLGASWTSASEPGFDRSSADREGNSIRRVTFEATVTNDDSLLTKRLEELGLSRKMNLASVEDWKRFQGMDNDNSSNPAEMDLVSLLVEKAIVRLNSPLLRLTAIADTPGTGSSRDRHDFISEQYIDHSEAFILLLRTGGDQYSKRVVSILKRIAKKYAGDVSGALARVAFVINADHKTAAQRENIDEYLRLAAVEFGLSKDRFTKHAKIFAIDLKNTESCGEKLLGFPSLKGLSNWISSEVFTLAAYRERLTRIRAVLTGQWDSTLRTLEKRLHDGELSIAEKETEMVQLKIFVEDGLPAVGESCLDYIVGLKQELVEIRDRILGIVGPYSNRTYEKHELGLLHDAVMESIKSFNEITSQATGVDPAELWIDEVAPRLRHLSLLLPGLCPPDKRALHFENGLQLNRARVERRFQKINDEWPNFFGWLWDRVKSMFGGEDIRCHLARKLHDTIREEMGRVIDVFARYEFHCKSFFGDAMGQIRTQMDERIGILRGEVGSAVDVVKLELQDVRSFQGERERILDELDKCVAGGVSANKNKKQYGRKR